MSCRVRFAMLLWGLGGERGLGASGLGLLSCLPAGATHTHTHSLPCHTERIAEDEDHVQSVDVVAFNKL